MMREQTEHFAVGMGGKRGTRRAGFLAPYFLALGLEDVLGLRAQQRDFLLGEAVGEEQIALLVEVGDLLGRELHLSPPGRDVRQFSARQNRRGIGAVPTAPHEMNRTSEAGRIQGAARGYSIAATRP